MSDLTFTFTLTKPPDPFEKIMYPGLEGFSISVEYGMRFDEEFKINKILIEKELPESEHTFVLKSIGSSKGTAIGIYLNTECHYSIFTQKIGETNEVYITGIEKTKNEFDQHVLRLRSYKISNPRKSTLYTNIIFDPVYTNQIKSSDCETALLGAPPAPNIESKIAEIKDRLKGEKLIIDTAPRRVLNTIQISNEGFPTMIAHIKDNIITYPYPALYKDKLTEKQVTLLAPLGLHFGGRRKPNRRTNRNKKRRRTHRV